MKLAIRLGAALALASCVALSGAQAASAPVVITAEAHSVTGGRTVAVLVAQSEIKTDINPSNLAMATGGGMLGGLLAASQNASRAKKAEAAIVPVRDALAGFDADALALETAKSAVAKVDWLQPLAVTGGKDSSLLGKSAFIDGGQAGQVVFIEYSYDLSPDFTFMRVVAKLQFAAKAMPAGQTKPEARLQPGNLAYAGTITSVVSLPHPGKDLAENAALWSADGGKLARAGLATAFAETDRLLPRTLALTTADIKAMNGKDKSRLGAGGFTGRLQETTPDGGTLMWAGGFISVKLLPAA